MTTDNETRENMRDRILATLRLIPNSRWWAAVQSEAAVFGLTSLAAAWVKHEGKFSAEKLRAFIETKIAPHCSGWMQELPEAPPPAPRIWRDEATGEVARNPWTDPPDLASQAAILAMDPATAKHFQRLAKDGGYTFAYAKERRDAEEQRQKRAQIRYGAEEHTPDKNVFLDPNNIKAHAAFTRENDPLVVERYRQEAATPFSCPWTAATFHLGAIGQIDRNDRTAGGIVRAAQKIEEAWRKSDLEEARAAEEKAASKRRTAEALLR
jgi:hypothetical protein